MKKIIAYLALGSNLEYPLQQLHTAREYISAMPETALLACSPCYQNPPLGPQDQDDFVNQVLKLSTQLEVKNLLAHCQNIEQRMGRVQIVRWGPRIIDLDLLLYADYVCEDKTLTLPHPGIYERLFFLQPLYDIAGDLQLPNGQNIADLLTAAQRTQRALTALT